MKNCVDSRTQSAKMAKLRKICAPVMQAITKALNKHTIFIAEAKEEARKIIEASRYSVFDEISNPPYYRIYELPDGSYQSNTPDSVFYGYIENYVCTEAGEAWEPLNKTIAHKIYYNASKLLNEEIYLLIDTHYEEGVFEDAEIRGGF